jgi:hypothetical protein
MVCEHVAELIQDSRFNFPVIACRNIALENQVSILFLQILLPSRDFVYGSFETDGVIRA